MWYPLWISMKLLLLLSCSAAAAVVGCVRVRCCRRVWPVVVEMSWVITAVGRLVSVLDEPNFSTTTSAPRPASSSLRPSCVHLCLARQITPLKSPAKFTDDTLRTVQISSTFFPFFKFKFDFFWRQFQIFYKLQLFDYSGVRHLVLSNTWTKLDQRNQ